MANYEETEKKPSNDDLMVRESSSNVIARNDDSRTEERESNAMNTSEGSQPGQAVSQRFSFLNMEGVTDEMELNKAKAMKEINELFSSVEDRVAMAVAVEKVAQLESKLCLLNEEKAWLIKVMDCLGTEWRKVREERKAEKEELENEVSGVMKVWDERIEEVREKQMEVRKKQMEVKRFENEQVNKLKDVLEKRRTEQKLIQKLLAAILLWLSILIVIELLF